jgi:hypothetical protein
MDISEDVLMQSLSDENNVSMDPCHEGVPEIDQVSVGESEESSQGSVSSTSLDKAKGFQRPALRKKHVSWSSIQTREYALVVGDHPLCQDGLPVSLDWQYRDSSPNSLVTKEAPKVSERKQSYVFPRRLSYEERRHRLCSVSGLTQDQVKNDEIDLVVRTLKEAWEPLAVETTTTLTTDMDNPLSEDMMIWDDVISQDLDIDLGDITDFEWTD